MDGARLKAGIDIIARRMRGITPDRHRPSPNNKLTRSGIVACLKSFNERFIIHHFDLCEYRYPSCTAITTGTGDALKGCRASCYCLSPPFCYEGMYSMRLRRS